MMGNLQDDRAKHIGEDSQLAGAWCTPLHTVNILDPPNKIKTKCQVFFLWGVINDLLHRRKSWSVFAMRIKLFSKIFHKKE